MVRFVIICVVLLLIGLDDAFSQESECYSPPLECPNSNITFFLYTKSTQDNPYQITTDDPDSISQAPINADNPIKILIHGYTGDHDYAPNAEIRPAYFQRGEFNVISVDWNPLAREPCYIKAAINTQLVGKCVANLIDTLVEKRDLPLEQFHVIGFSLGAHCAGAVGNWIQSGRMTRITGLDPAMPLFVTLDKIRKLDSEDADFVDVIHTDCLRRGKLEPSGKVDFYVNGCIHQPGCENHPNMSESSCNHWRAPVYYAESINSEVGFYGKRCKSWLHHLLGWCNLGGSSDDGVIMGEYASSDSRGQYFVETNKEEPFAAGRND